MPRTRSARPRDARLHAYGSGTPGSDNRASAGRTSAATGLGRLRQRRHHRGGKQRRRRGRRGGGDEGGDGRRRWHGRRRRQQRWRRRLRRGGWRRRGRRQQRRRTAARAAQQARAAALPEALLLLLRPPLPPPLPPPPHQWRRRRRRRYRRRRGLSNDHSRCSPHNGRAPREVVRDASRRTPQTARTRRSPADSCQNVPYLGTCKRSRRDGQAGRLGSGCASPIRGWSARLVEEGADRPSKAPQPKTGRGALAHCQDGTCGQGEAARVSSGWIWVRPGSRLCGPGARGVYGSWLSKCVSGICSGPKAGFGAGEGIFCKRFWVRARAPLVDFRWRTRVASLRRKLLVGAEEILVDTSPAGQASSRGQPARARQPAMRICTRWCSGSHVRAAAKRGFMGRCA